MKKSGVRRQSSLSSTGSSGTKASRDNNLGDSRSNLLSSNSSLSLAIKKIKNGSKRKLGFLGNAGNKKSTGFVRKSGGIALGHVVFGSDSQSASLVRSTSLPEKSSIAQTSKKRSISDTIVKNKSSLWSKVAINGFKKARGLSAN